MSLPFAILSTENLRHNIAVIRNIAPKSKMMVMLKANAYGHGIRSTAMRIDNLVDFIGVARIDEGLALRKVGIQSPICIMQGVFTNEDVITAACNNFELIVHDKAQLDCLDISTPRKVNVWLKVDTGIGRLGFSIDESMSVYQKLKSLSSVGTITLTSHFACADDIDHPLNQLQMKKFHQLAIDFPGPKSLANSAGIFNFKNSHYDVVRPGIALYGVSPIKGKIGYELGLKPVMTLMAKVMSVRDLEAGSTIGYGARFTTQSRIKLATIAIGYGDGYPRSASDGTKVLIKDKICEIIGRVSMDMTTVNMTNCVKVKCGDLVTLWGRNLPIEDISQHTENSPYDILTAVQLRVQFRWA
jgi:alanine racemase